MPDPSVEDLLRQQVAGLLKEAGDLRDFKRPPDGALPEEVHAALIEARGRLDRLEVICGNLATVKSAALSRARALEEAAQDAWDKLADAEARSPVRREWEGKEERYARWRVATFDLIRAGRQARILADAASDADAKAARAHRGLNGVRDELLKSLGYLQWVRHLEQ